MLRYFWEIEGKPGSCGHNQQTHLDFFSRYHTCVEEVNKVHDTGELKLENDFEIVQLTDDGDAAAFRQAGEQAAQAAKIRGAALEPLQKHI